MGSPDAARQQRVLLDLRSPVLQQRLQHVLLRERVEGAPLDPLSLLARTKAYSGAQCVRASQPAIAATVPGTLVMLTLLASESALSLVVVLAGLRAQGAQRA